MIKAARGGRGSFGSHFHITVHPRRKSGQELSIGHDLGGADAEAKKGLPPTALFLRTCSACPGLLLPVGR